MTGPSVLSIDGVEYSAKSRRGSKSPILRDVTIPLPLHPILCNFHAECSVIRCNIQGRSSILESSVRNKNVWAMTVGFVLCRISYSHDYQEANQCMICNLFLGFGMILFFGNGRMRTLCDGCEAAAAQYFCAADEAALCSKCDEKIGFVNSWPGDFFNVVKVHSCNKLASRHVRLQLQESWSVPRCDICETAPDISFTIAFYCQKVSTDSAWWATIAAFLHCSIDGSSLCLQCDMDVHIGGKRTHQRYLLLGQRVELPNGHPLREENGNPKAVDTARAWQKKYCQEHLHNVAPCHKNNVESNGHKE
eukprot:Gb_35653 [translate_table: standard]